MFPFRLTSRIARSNRSRREACVAISSILNGPMIEHPAERRSSSSWIPTRNSSSATKMRISLAPWAVSANASDVLIEGDRDDAFQAVLSEIQLDIAPEIGRQRPFKEKPSKPARSGNAHGWTAGLGP